MGIKFGDVDSSQIIENEFRISVLERLLEAIINENPDLKKPDQAQIEEVKLLVVDALKKKYPNSGISIGKK